MIQVGGYSATESPLRAFEQGCGRTGGECARPRHRQREGRQNTDRIGSAPSSRCHDDAGLRAIAATEPSSRPRHARARRACLRSSLLPPCRTEEGDSRSRRGLPTGHGPISRPAEQLSTGRHEAMDGASQYDPDGQAGPAGCHLVSARSSYAMKAEGIAAESAGARQLVADPMPARASRHRLSMCAASAEQAEGARQDAACHFGEMKLPSAQRPMATRRRLSAVAHVGQWWGRGHGRGHAHRRDRGE